jgi:hypothetical protein
MYSCRYGNYELLQIFYTLGFKIDPSNLVSLVHLTCYSENMKIIDCLLSYGEISHTEMTSLLRISAMLAKQEIALYFMIHGGFFIDDKSGSPWQYMNVFPKPNIALNSNTEFTVSSNFVPGDLATKALKTSEQKLLA